MHWCPMGVRKAQDAPTATDIRKVSGFSPIALAIPTAMDSRDETEVKRTVPVQALALPQDYCVGYLEIESEQEAVLLLLHL